MITKPSMQEIKQIFAEWTPSQLMDQVPGCTYLKDLEGTTIACSHSVHEDLLENPIGKTDHELFSKEEADQIRENDKSVIASRQPLTFVEKIQGKKRREPSLYFSIKAPLFDKNGNVIGIIGHSTKMTEMGPLLESL
ncbi:MAG: PAS domain-containing protein [Waddliaceae bacterium]